jgi:hypothetical protein
MYCIDCPLHLCAEEINEGSQAIVKAVAFLSGDRTLMGLRNSQVLQPTIATQNVGC